MTKMNYLIVFWHEKQTAVFALKLESEVEVQF